MTLLFFLSGIGTYYSLQYRSEGGYIKERANKLIIPWLVGMISICPLQAYFKGLYYGFSGNFLSFLSEFFSSKNGDYLGYAHLWFLLYLFTFSAICAPLFSKWLKENRLDRISSFLYKGYNILIPMAFIILIETILRPSFAVRPYIIYMDWANDLVYISVFVFGFVFASDSKIQERINKFTKISTVIALVCIPILVSIYYLWAVCAANAISLPYFWAFIKGVYECSAIIMLIGIGKKFLNKKTKAIVYLNKASFTYYYWHYLPVSALTYLVIRTNLNVYLKFTLVITLSYLFIFAFYELVVNKFFGLLNKRTTNLLNS
jgi:peptidoglycan/LPS O-acetylase OafA/YrhL